MLIMWPKKRSTHHWLRVVIDSATQHTMRQNLRTEMRVPMAFAIYFSGGQTLAHEHRDLCKNSLCTESGLVVA